MTSSLVQLDWSVDSTLLTVVTETNDLLFVNVVNKQKVDPGSVRDV
jgi:hypothetical protein